MTNKIKEYRLACGLTQQDLAHKLQTTQQTIARWESGQSEPNLATLRDIALLFKTSVDDLLGANPFSNKLVTGLYFIDSPDIDKLWGHAGVQIAPESNLHWFPITDHAYAIFQKNIKKMDAQHSWVSLQTLNNQLLIINLKNCHKIIFTQALSRLDDVTLEWDSLTGFSLETYRALYEKYHNLGNYSSEENYTTNFKLHIETLGERHDLNVEDIENRVLLSHFYYREDYTKYQLSESDLIEALKMIETTAQAPLTFSFTDMRMQATCLLPSEKISMVKLPLYRVMDTIKINRL